VFVKEAKSLYIPELWIFFHFSFSRRTCDNASHELANLGANSKSDDSFWDASAPVCIATLLGSDLAVLV
jgi:hypothetical protein